MNWEHFSADQFGFYSSISRQPG